MASVLSREDVDRLLAGPSPSVREDLAAKLAVALAQPDPAPAEIALAQDILRILARDVEAAVRASVARGLRDSRHLPHDVALTLARDIDNVAQPILSGSRVLTDADLIDLVRHGTAIGHEAIAARPRVNEAVADAIIAHAEEPAVSVLLHNHTARIAEQSLDRAIARFSASERVKHAMVARPVLPIGIAERLVAIVSSELQDVLVRRHALPPAVASGIVLRSREHAVIRLSMGSSEEALGSMVKQMHLAGRLTPTLILRAVCTGDIAFFEAAMAVKADIPVANAQLLIHDSSGRGLAALYRKATMPENLFDAIQAAVGVVDETKFDGDDRDLERFRARIISRVLTVTDSLDLADADYLVDVLEDTLHAP